MKIALLIDADNANAKYMDKVIDDLKNHGEICERLIFGDWKNSHLSSWDNAILKHALKQNQQNSYVKGKNATDIALVISAMEILYTNPHIDTFAIMSSDSDFTPLVQKLRQVNKKVWGFISNNTSDNFKQACDDITELNAGNQNIKFNEITPALTANNIPQQKSLNDQNKQVIIKVIQDITDSGRHDNGFICLSVIGSELAQRNINATSLGFGMLKNVLFLIDELEYEFSTPKNNYQFRLKNYQAKPKTNKPIIQNSNIQIDNHQRKKNLNNNTKLINEIEQIISQKSKNNKFIKLSTISSILGNEPRRLKSKDYGYKSWEYLFHDLDFICVATDLDNQVWVKIDD